MIDYFKPKFLAYPYWVFAYFVIVSIFVFYLVAIDW